MNRALAKRIVARLSCSDSHNIHFDEFLPRDWEHTFSWLHGSGLTFHLFRQIENDKSVPAGIRSRLKSDLASNTLRMNDMFGEFKSINQLFESAGLTFAVQKGFSLVPEYCTLMELRHQTDFDYLISPQSLNEARDILRSRGYTGESHYDQEFVLRTPFTREPNSHDFFGLQPSRCVELHLALWEEKMCQVSLPAPEDALEHIQMRTLHEHVFPALSTEDIFLCQTTHVLRHIFAFWGRLSWLLEIATFIRTRERFEDNAFWDRVRQRTRQNKHMAEALGVVLCLAELLFDLQVPRALAAWTTDTLSQPARLWVKRYGWEFSLAPAPGSKLSLLLQEYFMADSSIWRQQRSSRLFPMHRPLAFASEPPSAKRPTPQRKWRQRGLHVLHRSRFHLRSFLRYVFELPRWRQALRRERLRQQTLGTAS